MTTIARHRADQSAELYRLDNLRAKLNAICASLRECHSARQNGRVGNLAFDVETLAHEIGKTGSRLLASASEISVLEYEDAQRQAEIDHAPLVAELREIIAGSPKVVELRAARQIEGAA